MGAFPDGVGEYRNKCEANRLVFFANWADGIYMKTAALRSFLLAACVCQGTSLQAFTERGGIVYFTFTTELCPGFTVVRPAPNRIEVRRRTDQVCVPIYPPPMGEFTFVLGALPAGPVHVLIDNGLFVDEYVWQGYETTDRPISAITMDSSGHMSFHVNGIENVNYIVQRSFDLENWADVTQLTGDSDFVDPNTTAGSVFYQLKIPEVQVRPLPLTP